MTKLNLDIIESFLTRDESKYTDYDDAEYRYYLPGSGEQITCMWLCNGEQTECDSLEGFSGWIYIKTKEELEEILDLSYVELIYWLNNYHKDFPLELYMDEFDNEDKEEYENLVKANEKN